MFFTFDPFDLTGPARFAMSTSNPANLVIIVELKDIDEELCRVGELDSAMEAFKGSNTRDNLSAAFATQLTKSHASQDAPRASSPIENIRILPSWTQ